MDALIYWTIGLCVSAFAGIFWWAITDSKREATRRLKEDLERLGASKEQLEKINEAQATPFPDAKSANSWLSKYRARHD